MGFFVGPQEQSGLDLLLGSVAQGAGEGIGSSLEKFYQQKEQQKKAAQFEKAGLPGAFAEIDPKIVSELLKGQREQSILSSFLNQDQMQPGNGFSSPKESVQPFREKTSTAPDEQIEFPQQKKEIPEQKQKIEELSPILASKSVAPPVSSAQIPQYQSNIQQAIKRSDQLTKAGRDRREEKAASAEEILPFVKRGQQIIDKKGVSGFAGFIQAKLGEKYPQLKGADVKEIQRITKEIALSKFRSQFGSRPSQSEFFYIQDIYLRAGDPKDSMKRSLKLEEELAKLAIKSKEIESDILRKYGGKYNEFPLNLDEMVSKAMMPYQNQFLKNIGYNDWVKNNPELASNLNETDKRINVYDEKGKLKGSVLSQEVNQLPEGWTVK